jgi:hypothetical protein
MRENPAERHWRGISADAGGLKNLFLLSPGKSTSCHVAELLSQMYIFYLSYFHGTDPSLSHIARSRTGNAADSGFSG